MSLVLAIEPDRAQADILREIHDTLGVQLVVVGSKDEAVAAVDRGVPDLILVNALLSPREEVDLVAYLRSLDNLSHLQLLTIPRLARKVAAPPKRTSLFAFGKKRSAAPPPDGCDPAAFAEEVTLYLSRAQEVKARPKPRAQPASKPQARTPMSEEPAPVYQAHPPAYASEPPAPTYEPPPHVAPVYEPRVDAAPVYEPPAVTASPAMDAFEASLLELPADEPITDVDSLFDRLGFAPAPAPADAEPPSWADLPAAPAAAAAPATDPVRPEPVEPEVLIDLDSLPAAVEPEPVPRKQAPDIAMIRAEAEAALAAELQRAQAEAAQQRERELAQWQAEAEALREATIGRARAEAEAEAREALAAELQRARLETEQVRQQEIARLQAQADERLEQVSREARELAEHEAARALTEELARVRADSETAAARALDAEVARVRGEADARLQAELDRVRREAEEAHRLEQAAATAEAERIREAAAREARQIAEAAAARTLEAEIQRVRAEAEAVRAAAEARLAEQSRAHAEASHAIAEAERVREAAAREAREIAEATATRRLEAELERVRREADERLAAHNEAQRQAEQSREATLREAHAAAEAAAARKLEAEIQRVRADADRRLATELEQLRADAEQRRAQELEEVRRQVDDVRAAAAEQARVAAAEAIAAEVARVSALRSTAPPPAVVPVVRVDAARPAAPPAAAPPAPAPQPSAAPEDEAGDTPAASYYDLWRAEGSPPLSTAAQPAPWARSLPSRFTERRWMLPAAAAALLVVCGGIGVTVNASAWAATARKALESALPSRSAESATAASVAPATGDLLVETTPKGAKVTVDGTQKGRTPLTVTGLKPGPHKIVLESGDGVVIRREVTIRAGERAVTSELMVSGWLTVSSRVPVEVHAYGRRVGSSGGEQIMLAPGRHRMTFINKAHGIRETRTIEIRAGSISSHTVDLPDASLQVDAPAGSEVLVDGSPVGVAPLSGASIPAGSHEVLVRHESFGERRQTVNVTPGGRVTVTVDAAAGPEHGRSFDGLKVLSESAANPGLRKRRP